MRELPVERKACAIRESALTPGVHTRGRAVLKPFASTRRPAPDVVTQVIAGIDREQDPFHA